MLRKVMLFCAISSLASFAANANEQQPEKCNCFEEEECQPKLAACPCKEKEQLNTEQEKENFVLACCSGCDCTDCKCVEEEVFLVADNKEEFIWLAAQEDKENNFLASCEEEKDQFAANEDEEENFFASADEREETFLAKFLVEGEEEEAAV